MYRVLLVAGSLFVCASLVQAGNSNSLIDVSPDGKRFVMARPLDGTGTQLLVWTGWLDEVRRRLVEQ